MVRLISRIFQTSFCICPHVVEDQYSDVDSCFLSCLRPESVKSEAVIHVSRQLFSSAKEFFPLRQKSVIVPSLI